MLMFLMDQSLVSSCRMAFVALSLLKMLLILKAIKPSIFIMFAFK